MKTKIYLSIAIILFCFSCKGKTNTNASLTKEAETAIETLPIDTSENDFWLVSLEELEEGYKSLLEELEEDYKSLNDIRFENWTEENWLDNDYFRFLRKCFDDCYKGIENEDTHCLLDYKPLLNNQYYIYKVEPYLLGGLFITLGFLNNPEILYETVVYSDVDRDTETVTGYSLRGFHKSKTSTTFTTKQLLEILKDNPLNKLW